MKYSYPFDSCILPWYITFQTVYFDALQVRSKFLKSWKTKVVNPNFCTKHISFYLYQLLSKFSRHNINRYFHKNSFTKHLLESVLYFKMVHRIIKNPDKLLIVFSDCI